MRPLLHPVRIRLLLLLCHVALDPRNKPSEKTKKKGGRGGRGRGAYSILVRRDNLTIGHPGRVRGGQYTTNKTAAAQPLDYMCRWHVSLRSQIFECCIAKNDCANNNQCRLSYSSGLDIDENCGAQNETTPRSAIASFCFSSTPAIVAAASCCRRPWYKNLYCCSLRSTAVGTETNSTWRGAKPILSRTAAIYFGMVSTLSEKR